ncbi:hypothetical protein SAMN05444339_105200 [Loktanella atrilutea]|uniref:PH domain-containing protein n=1 Tax=Loktanella atrilutea TaxID=366533 RepID=A0A1M5B237_LOKAT|nr:hypothetical protein [Loktanella atrilutea]SHF36574.1 hypothetical protein SAMN05444339_105200 [Loktanella atrilutea]
MTPSSPPDHRQALSLSPTPARTGGGIAVMLGLAALLLRTAPGQEPLPQAVMIAVAVATLWVAFALWRGRHDCLRWTAQGLIDGQGRVIAPRDAIQGVDRSPLSLRPSNGFNLALRRAQPRAWQPGLYWCLGRRVGIGGLAPPSESKAMADRIALDTAPPPE